MILGMWLITPLSTKLKLANKLNQPIISILYQILRTNKKKRELKFLLNTQTMIFLTQRQHPLQVLNQLTPNSNTTLLKLRRWMILTNSAIQSSMFMEAWRKNKRRSNLQSKSSRILKKRKPQDNHLTLEKIRKLVSVALIIKSRMRRRTNSTSSWLLSSLP